FCTIHITMVRLHIARIAAVCLLISFPLLAYRPVNLVEYVSLLKMAPGLNDQQRSEALRSAGVCLTTASYMSLVRGAEPSVHDTQELRSFLLCGYADSITPDADLGLLPAVARDHVSQQFSGPDYRVAAWLSSQGSRTIATIKIENNASSDSSRIIQIASLTSQLRMNGKTYLAMNEEQVVQPLKRSQDRKNALHDLFSALFEATPT